MQTNHHYENKGYFRPQYTLSAGAVEYTYWTSAEGWDFSPDKRSGYDTKQSGGKAPILDLTLENVE